MPVSRIDQSKGRWWDQKQVGESCKAGYHDECKILGCKCQCHEKELRQAAKPAAVLQFRRLKEERCGGCNRKMIDKGGVWNYGEQRGLAWTPIRQFCKKCFESQVRPHVRKFISRMEAEGQEVVIKAFKGTKLADWINFEAQDLEEIPVGTELPSGRRVGDEPAKEPEKKTIHLFGQTVEVVGDYEGLALPKNKETRHANR